MRIIFLTVFLFLSFTSIFAQYSLKKIWESDSVTLKGPESATYDPVSKVVYISSMNNGSLVKWISMVKLSMQIG